ncbi:MAG: EF-hand domain-containing protein [Planctomycetota bacterium]|nr:EF-hand domain-containing protein [Planctomycetota bacterium]MDA0935020.1 EF-hand domain-containing protein [Planctomycetota bacterium]MDA1223284.1 EF-hand domain-containing protein [Planctomycetota bacterium]
MNHPPARHLRKPLSWPRLAAALCALGMVSGAAKAQQQGPGEREPELAVETVWSETRGLALFAACDRNGDDRLDLFEVRHCLVDLQATRDPSVFRRLDTDNSGFVEWPEFAERFKVSLGRAGRFQVQPYRQPAAMRDPASPSSEIDPSEQMLGALDGDGDGGLSRAEFTAFVRRMAGNAELVNRFAALDTDRSGKLELTEFAPVLMFVPQVWQKMSASEDLRRAMPADFRGADRDLNGVIDRAELRASLTRLHPSLGHWTDVILNAADRSRNGTLGAAELVASRTVRPKIVLPPTGDEAASPARRDR